VKLPSFKPVRSINLKSLSDFSTVALGFELESEKGLKAWAITSRDGNEVYEFGFGEPFWRRWEKVLRERVIFKFGQFLSDGEWHFLYRGLLGYGVAVKKGMTIRVEGRSVENWGDGREDGVWALFKKVSTYTYNDLNQLVSLTDENGTRNFTYDANGNCTSDGKRQYEWDVQNRLIKVVVPNEGEVRFRYRHDEMRVEKQVVGGLTTKYVYDGQTVIGEIRSDGTKRWYVVGAMGHICRIDEDANGQILARDYFVYDGLGSCRALVASNGVVVAKYDYDAHGAVREQNSQRSNSFKYVAQIGHPTDEETGLIYMRARYYEPLTGRFISEDPSRNGNNWYLYADGNPVNRADLNGQIAGWIAVILVTLDLSLAGIGL